VGSRPGIDVSLPRGLLIPLRLAAVLALAELSYRFVELPFRGRKRLPALPDEWQRFARPALAAAVLAVVVVIGWSGLFITHSNPEAATASTATVAIVKPRPEKAGRGPAAGHAARRPPRIVALGDSVMIGAKERLTARLGRRFSMNAKVGRQADEFVALARRLKASGQKIDAMIIQMGNNGSLYSEDMEALRKATSNVGELFFVTDYAPVSWEGESNHAL
jgi:branched-subunit amino acid transport protein